MVVQMDLTSEVRILSAVGFTREDMRASGQTTSIKIINCTLRVSTGRRRGPGRAQRPGGQRLLPAEGGGQSAPGGRPPLVVHILPPHPVTVYPQGARDGVHGHDVPLLPHQRHDVWRSRRTRLQPHRHLVQVPQGQLLRRMAGPLRKPHGLSAHHPGRRALSQEHAGQEEVQPHRQRNPDGE